MRQMQGLSQNPISSKEVKAKSNNSKKQCNDRDKIWYDDLKNTPQKEPMQKIWQTKSNLFEIGLQRRPMWNLVSPKSRCKAQKQIQSLPETILRVCHIVLLDQPTLSAKSKFIKGRIDLKICNSRFTQLLKPAWEIKVYQKHLGHLGLAD